jgi:hypothetical protein
MTGVSFVLIAENGEKRPNLDFRTLVYIKHIIGTQFNTSNILLINASYTNKD